MDIEIEIKDLPPAAAALALHIIAAQTAEGVTSGLTLAQVSDLVIARLTDSAPAALDAWLELVAQIEENEDGIAALVAAIALKADAADTDIHDLTAKTTPVDADELRVADSAASYGFKKLTFASIWAWVKSKILGEIVTPWVSYTPVFAGLGTVSSISMWSRRVGDTLHVRGHFTTGGTLAATEARLSLGFNGTEGGVTIDSTKVAGLQHCGDLAQGGVTASKYFALAEGSVGYLTFGVESASTAGLTKQQGSVAFNTSRKYSIRADVPITGW